MKLSNLIPGFCLVFLSVTALQADTIFLTPEEDSFIQGGERSMEICRTAYLEVAARGTSRNDAALRKIFLAFDVDAEVAAKLASAKLVLTYRPGSTVISLVPGDESPVDLAVYGATGEDWSEEFLTWDEAPFHDQGTGSESNNTLVTLLAEQTVDPTSPDFGTSLTFSDEKIVEFIRDNPERITFIITAEGTRSMPGLRFYDKDGTSNSEFMPTLILEIK